ncbi:FAST kinase domain-containing protein 4-like [Haliotis rubra]|uniref:FAST kinase domain-containing protein 4-like n=1 Tax=Haliotis rubra TaxID=36100 RepID=UPI001EE630A5|nr:FAST kinase domain-containing protein 4-like [Haliotis rubra]
MYSKQIFTPLWRQLCLHRSHRAAAILPQVTSSQCSFSTTTDTSSHDSKYPNELLGDSQTKRASFSITARKSSWDLTPHIKDSTIEDLELMFTKVLFSHEMSQVLARLNELRRQGCVQVESLGSGNFSLFEDRLLNGIPYLSITDTVSCLLPLIEMYETDTAVIEALGQKVLESIQICPLSSLIKLVSHLQNHQQSPLRTKIIQHASTRLGEQWEDITKPSLLLSLMYAGYSVKATDDLALTLVQNMSAKHLSRVLFVLAKKQRRNEPLIRAVVKHLNKQTQDMNTLSLKDFAKLFYACSRLNVYDTELLRSITDNTTSNLQPDPFTLLSILRSLSELQWKDETLLEGLTGLLEKGLGELSAMDKAKVVISIARLNYVSPQTDSLVKVILSSDLASVRDEDPAQWLDLVWSLAILNKADSAMIVTVLDSSFMEYFPVEDTYRKWWTDMKLMNINTTAQLELPGYDGPLLPAQDQPKTTEFMKKNRSSAKLIEKALSTMVPLEKYVKSNIFSSSGYHIDAELFVDKSGTPKPYDTSVDDPELHRVCILVQDYLDMTLHDIAPTGAPGYEGTAPVSPRLQGGAGFLHGPGRQEHSGEDCTVPAVEAQGGSGRIIEI